MDVRADENCGGATLKRNLRTSHRPDEEGQSVLEFVLMLPLMVGFTVIMMKVNTVIQMSIVNQKYARAQALYLTFNSAWYPTLLMRSRSSFSDGSWNRMVIGVSENPAARADSGENYNPETSIQMIARTRAKAGREGGSQEEPDERGFVHLRTTVALCTQSNYIVSGGGQAVPLVPTPAQLRDPFDVRTLQYCRSPLDE